MDIFNENEIAEIIKALGDRIDFLEKALKDGLPITIIPIYKDSLEHARLALEKITVISNKMHNSRGVTLSKGQVIVDEDAFNHCIAENERLLKIVKSIKN